MGDPENERDQIREQKRKELTEELDEEHSGGVPTEPIEIDSEAHLDEVVADHEVVLVDCYADWCGPCQMMEPAIEGVAADSEAAVAKVDVDRHQGLAGQLGVQGVPTLLLYVDGDPVEQLVGAQDRGTLDQLVAQAG